MDNVIRTKFAEKLTQKRGLSRFDIRFPVSNTTGERFDSYYTTEVTETETALYGVKNDGTTELIGMNATPITNLIAKLYNSGGFYSKAEVDLIIQQN